MSRNKFGIMSAVALVTAAIMVAAGVGAILGNAAVYPSGANMYGRKDSAAGDYYYPSDASSYEAGETLFYKDGNHNRSLGWSLLNLSQKVDWSNTNYVKDDTYGFMNASQISSQASNTFGKSDGRTLPAIKLFETITNKGPTVQAFTEQSWNPVGITYPYYGGDPVFTFVMEGAYRTSTWGWEVGNPLTAEPLSYADSTIRSNILSDFGTVLGEYQETDFAQKYLVTPDNVFVEDYGQKSGEQGGWQTEASGQQPTVTYQGEQSTSLTTDDNFLTDEALQDHVWIPSVTEVAELWFPAANLARSYDKADGAGSNFDVSWLRSMTQTGRSGSMPDSVPVGVMANNVESGGFALAYQNNYYFMQTQDTEDNGSAVRVAIHISLDAFNKFEDDQVLFKADGDHNRTLAYDLMSYAHYNYPTMNGNKVNKTDSATGIVTTDAVGIRATNGSRLPSVKLFDTVSNEGTMVENFTSQSWRLVNISRLPNEGQGTTSKSGDAYFTFMMEGAYDSGSWGSFAAYENSDVRTKLVGDGEEQEGDIDTIFNVFADANLEKYLMPMGDVPGFNSAYSIRNDVISIPSVAQINATNPPRSTNKSGSWNLTHYERRYDSNGNEDKAWVSGNGAGADATSAWSNASQIDATGIEYNSASNSIWDESYAIRPVIHISVLELLRGDVVAKFGNELGYDAGNGAGIGIYNPYEETQNDVITNIPARTSVDFKAATRGETEIHFRAGSYRVISNAHELSLKIVLGGVVVEDLKIGTEMERKAPSLLKALDCEVESILPDGRTLSYDQVLARCYAWQRSAKPNEDGLTYKSKILTFYLDWVYHYLFTENESIDYTNYSWAPLGKESIPLNAPLEIIVNTVEGTMECDCCGQEICIGKPAHVATGTITHESCFCDEEYIPEACPCCDQYPCVTKPNCVDGNFDPCQCLDSIVEEGPYRAYFQGGELSGTYIGEGFIIGQQNGLDYPIVAGEDFKFNIRIQDNYGIIPTPLVIMYFVSGESGWRYLEIPDYQTSSANYTQDGKNYPILLEFTIPGVTGNIYITHLLNLVKIKEATPQITINYETVKLDGFEVDASYKIDAGQGFGEAIWMSSSSININDDWFGKGIRAIKVGGVYNEITVADSEVQVIAIKNRPTAPVLNTTNCSELSVEDGVITVTNPIVGASYEYRRVISGVMTWVPFDGTFVTGLRAGIYDVRVKGSNANSTFPSLATRETVGIEGIIDWDGDRNIYIMNFAEGNGFTLVAGNGYSLLVLHGNSFQFKLYLDADYSRNAISDIEVSTIADDNLTINRTILTGVIGSDSNGIYYLYTITDIKADQIISVGKVLPNTSINGVIVPAEIELSAMVFDSAVLLQCELSDTNQGLVYGYEYTMDGWITSVFRTGEGAEFYTFYGLTNDKEYSFAARAVGPGGKGIAGTTVATPCVDGPDEGNDDTTPSAVILSSEAGNGQVTVISELSGAVAVVWGVEYAISIDVEGTLVVITVIKTYEQYGLGAESHTFEGLTNGIEYSFTARAFGPGGYSVYANTSATPTE